MNEQVLNQLPSAPKVARLTAYLEVASDGATVPFLYNPEARSFSVSAKYAEVATGAVAIPEQNYIHSTGRSLQLNGLLIDTFNAERSARLLITELESLLTAPEGKTAPEPVYFVWGSERFGPAVLTAMSWEEDKWLGGEVAGARVSITLLQIPAPPVEVSPTASPTGDTSLTERQKAEGNAQALTSLQGRSVRLPANIQSAINSGTATFAAADNGTITLGGLTGDMTIEVGVWDGFTFTEAIL